MSAVNHNRPLPSWIASLQFKIRRQVLWSLAGSCNNGVINQATRLAKLFRSWDVDFREVTDFDIMKNLCSVDWDKSDLSIIDDGAYRAVIGGVALAAYFGDALAATNDENLSKSHDQREGSFGASMVYRLTPKPMQFKSEAEVQKLGFSEEILKESRAQKVAQAQNQVRTFDSMKSDIEFISDRLFAIAAGTDFDSEWHGEGDGELYRADTMYAWLSNIGREILINKVDQGLTTVIMRAAGNAQLADQRFIRSSDFSAADGHLALGDRLDFRSIFFVNRSETAVREEERTKRLHAAQTAALAAAEAAFAKEEADAKAAAEAKAEAAKPKTKLRRVSSKKQTAAEAAAERQYEKELMEEAKAEAEAEAEVERDLQISERAMAYELNQ